MWAPANEDYLRESIIWGIEELEFYGNLGCTGSPIDTSSTRGEPIESSNAGKYYNIEPRFGPQLAFDGDTTGSDYHFSWHSYIPGTDNFWLGFNFTTTQVEVKCIKIYQDSFYFAKKMHIQAMKDGEWVNVWDADNLNVSNDHGNNLSTIPLDYSNTGPYVDSPLKWYDSNGPSYDCEWYRLQESNCENYDDSYANMGKTANEACCACNGGRK